MHKRFMLATVALLAFAGAAQAETLQEVQDKIHDIVSKYKSLQFKMKMTSETSMAGFSTKTDSDSQVEAAKKGDTVVSRVDSKMRTSTNMGGQETKMDMKSLMIDDGKDLWNISESPTKQIAKMKRDPNSVTYFNPKAGWKQVAEHFELKLMPDETMDGKACWVMAMEPKDPTMKMVQSKTITYYDKKTGLGHKTVTFGPEGKRSGEIIMSDIKIDADISADRFTYTPPAGAKVEDMTKQDIGAMLGGKGDAKSGDAKDED